MTYQTFRSRAEKVGQEPGAIIHIGDQKTERVTLQLIDYDDKEHFIERTPADLDDLANSKAAGTVTWVNVNGLHQVEVIEAIGQFYDIHPLLLEDILNTDQRPKIDHYDTYIYLILKVLRWQQAASRITAEQISIVLGRNFVLTFEEQPGDFFDPVRNRIREGKGRIRKYGADYLAYTILDNIIDHYFLILEMISDQIEELEEELIGNPTSSTLQSIYRVKRDVMFLRKAIWPLRDVIGSLQHDDSDVFHSSTPIYLRDIYEHTIQIIDTVETFRDVIAGMLDIYLSSVSNKMNEVMKLLTVMATIFIPLTFITSLYGMNFEFMPELAWRWGYAGVWLVMILMAAVMLFYFRRKRWL